MLWQDRKDIIANAWSWLSDELKVYDQRIKLAQNEWNQDLIDQLYQEKQNKLIWISRYNRYLDSILDTIIKKWGEKNLDETMPIVLDVLQSDELKAFKNLITNESTISRFQNSDWIIDYNSLAKFLENSDQLQNLWAYALWEKAIAANIQRQIDIDQAETALWKTFYKIKKWWYDMVWSPQWSKYQESQYLDTYLKWRKAGWNDIIDETNPDFEFTDEYIEKSLWVKYDFSWIEQYKQWIRGLINTAGEEWAKEIVEKKKKQWKRRWDDITDPVTKAMMNMDPERSQNYWRQMWDVLEFVWDKIQAYPWDFAMTIWALAIPYIWTADKIAEAVWWANALNKTTKFWRFVYNFWPKVFWEFAEGQLMNMFFDNTNYWHAEPIWDLLDVWIWSLKWLMFLKRYRSLDDFLEMSNLEKIMEPLEKKYWKHFSFDQLTNEDKILLNKKFKLNWLGGIVNKNFENYLKTDSKWNVVIDKIALYKDYSANYSKFLWIEWQNRNRTIRQKILQNNLRSELDTLNDEAIDGLFRRAAKAIKNNDITKSILKDSGKKGVIRYWLTSELNSLKKIWQTKMWVYTLMLMEGAWNVNKKMNEEFTKLIWQLQIWRNAAKTPEQIEFFDEAIKDARDLRSQRRLLPLQLSDATFGKALELHKAWVEDFNEKYATLIWNSNFIEKNTPLIDWAWSIKTLDEWWISWIKQEIIDLWNSGDPDAKQKVAELILGKQWNFEEFWWKVYNVDEYIDGLKNLANTTLTEWQIDRLWKVLEVLDGLSKWDIRIIELPNEIKKSVAWMQWFMWYLKKGKNQEWVIALASWLIWWTKNLKFKDINVLVHELWHMLFLSLKENIQSKLINATIDLIDWKEIGESFLKDLGISGWRAWARYAELIWIYKKDKTAFVEELVADMLSNAISAWIKWDWRSLTTIWEWIIKQMTKWEQIREITKTDQPFEILWNKFVDMLTSLYDAIEVQRWTEELKWIMYYVAASILEWKPLEKATTDWKKIKRTTIFWRGSKTKYVPTNDFFAYSEIVNKADLNFMKKEWDKVATLDQWITSFDVAEIYSTSTVIDLLNDPNITAEHLWQLISTRWLDFATKAEILKWTTEQTATKFLKAIEIAEQRQEIMVNNLLKFWKDWEIDLSTKIDWYSFADILNNIAVKVTKNWYVDFAWIDFTKFINGSDKELYNKIFYDYMKNISSEYQPEVIKDIMTKLSSAWVVWKDFPEMRVDFATKIQNSLMEKAKKWWIDSDTAKMIAEDVCSRLFAGSFYYMSNINSIKAWTDVSHLVDDFAYWILLKNKWQSDSKHYTELYDLIEKQYLKAADYDNNLIINPEFSTKLTDITLDRLKDTQSIDPSSFRWRWYNRGVFNILAARWEEYFISVLRDLWDAWQKLKLSNINWSTFVNWITSWKSLTKTIVWDMVLKAWFWPDVIDVSLKLGDAHTLDEVCDVYIKALWDKRNINLIWKEVDKESLIKKLEDLKSKWFSEKDYNSYLSELENKYMVYAQNDTKLEDYFRSVLTTEDIKDLNIKYRNKLRSLTEPVPSTLPKEFKTDIVKIDSELSNPQIQEWIKKLVTEINNRNNLVMEWKEGYIADVAKIMLNDDLYKPFFEISNKSELVRLEWGLTTSSYSKIQQLVFEVSSEEYKKQGNRLTRQIWKYVNLTTVAAKERNIWYILDKWVKFVDENTVYVGKWNIADFFKEKNFTPKSKNYTIKAVINEIVDTLNKAIKQWVTPNTIKDDIVNMYTRRYHTTTKVDSKWKEVVEAKQIWKDPNKTKYITAKVSDSLMKEYEAAINAYVDVLSKRHTTMWNLSEEQLQRFLWNALWNSTASKFSLSSEKADYASQILWLGWYWLWVSTKELDKLDKYAEVWHPDLFKNFLYKTFQKTDNTFWLVDRFWNFVKNVESTAADLMYAVFYTIPAWVPAAMQQVFTNFTEIFAKTLGEIASEDIDMKTIDEIQSLIADLMPSEIASFSKWRLSFWTRAELDIATRTSILRNGINKVLSSLSALTYADKSAERMVKNYWLASALVAQWFNKNSAQELVSNVVAKMNDFWKSWLEWIISFDDILKFDTEKTERILTYKINNLVENGKITVGDWISLKNYWLELSEMLEPLRTAARQANYMKNAFFQISKIPELTQNLLAWKVWAANMRFFNWGSRKAWEYAFNIADAIMREDWQQLQKYIANTFYRWLIWAKIYAQLDKANQNWEDFYSFMKMIFLPFTVLDMALFNAFDIIKNVINETSKDKKEDRKYFKAAYNWFIDWENNLKNRFYSAPIYWAGKILEQYNWRKLLNEKAVSADYVSWQFVSVPLVQDILNALQKAFTWRLTKYRRRTVWWIFKDNPWRPYESWLFDMLFGTNITKAAKNEQDIIDLWNQLMFWDEEFWWNIALEIVPYSRDSSLAYKTVTKRFESNGLTYYFRGWSYLKELQQEFDILSDIEKNAKALEEQWFDWELYKQLVEEFSDWEGDSNSTKWANTVLSLALMKSSKMQWFLDAWKGLTKEERDNFVQHVKDITNEILSEIEKTKQTNKSLLKNAAYDKDAIESLVDKYWNRYWEEILIATYIKSIVTDYKKEERKALKKKFWDSYAENLYGEGGINDLLENGWKLNDGYTVYWSINLLNELVLDFYPTLMQGNELIPNTMMYLHWSLKPDYPLNSKINISSAFWAQIDDYFMMKNYENRWYWDSWIWTLWSYMVKRVINSNDVSWEDKVAYINKMVDYADLQWPFAGNMIRAWLTPMLLEKYTQISNTDPEFRERNKDWLEPEFKKITVSRPLSDEDIKEEVRKTVFKSTKSWSWSWRKWRKWSVSFNDLANELTKFQAMKRQFEEHVLWQTPIQKIAYKATSHWVTPIQLSVWEAHEIDQKYTFITPKKPESEKTPDIVVKQVKTSTSKYSGKAIKQSNVYKTKKIL